jgi:hypothetical protein
MVLLADKGKIEMLSLGLFRHNLNISMLHLFNNTKKNSRTTKYRIISRKYKQVKCKVRNTGKYMRLSIVLS